MVNICEFNLDKINSEGKGFANGLCNFCSNECKNNCITSSCKDFKLSSEYVMNQTEETITDESVTSGTKQVEETLSLPLPKDLKLEK